MIAVDRVAGGSAMRHLLRAGQAAAAEGRQMVIFPEGTRVAPGDARPYQPGVAALAAATGLPVIPVATDSGLLWGRRAFHKRPGTITVAVLPPLPAGPAAGRPAASAGGRRSSRRHCCCCRAALWINPWIERAKRFAQRLQEGSPKALRRAGFPPPGPFWNDLSTAAVAR